MSTFANGNHECACASDCLVGTFSSSIRSLVNCAALLPHNRSPCWRLRGERDCKNAHPGCQRTIVLIIIRLLLLLVEAAGAVEKMDNRLPRKGFSLRTLRWITRGLIGNSGVVYGDKHQATVAMKNYPQVLQRVAHKAIGALHLAPKKFFLAKFLKLLSNRKNLSVFRESK